MCVSGSFCTAWRPDPGGRNPKTRRRRPAALCLPALPHLCGEGAALIGCTLSTIRPCREHGDKGDTGGAAVTG